MALEVEASVEIAAPRERVWAIVAEHERMPEWLPVREVVRRRPGRDDPNGVGAVRTVRGWGSVVDEEIVEFSPPARLAYRLRAGAPVRDHRGELELEPCAAGTRVRWRARWRPLIPGSGPLLRAALTRLFRAGLEGLRLYAETGAPPRKRGKMRRRAPSAEAEKA